MNTCFLFSGGSTAPTIAQDFPHSSSTRSLVSASPGLPTTCTLTRSTSILANRCSEESITQGIEPNISSIVYWRRRILLQRCASSSARQPSRVSNCDRVLSLDGLSGGRINCLDSFKMISQKTQERQHDIVSTNLQYDNYLGEAACLFPASTISCTPGFFPTHSSLATLAGLYLCLSV